MFVNNYLRFTALLISKLLKTFKCFIRSICAKTIFGYSLSLNRTTVLRNNLRCSTHSSFLPFIFVSHAPSPPDAVT